MREAVERNSECTKWTKKEEEDERNKIEPHIFYYYKYIILTFNFSTWLCVRTGFISGCHIDIWHWQNYTMENHLTATNCVHQAHRYIDSYEF